jgi:Protein of unknown function (DUF1566)
MTERRKIRLPFVVAAIVLGASLTVAAPGAWAGSFPTWDKKVSPNKRFSKRFDGAAYLDRETGIVWEASPSLGMTVTAWAGAAGGCQIIQVGGRGGWRLPSVEEFLSLLDASQSSPALPVGHPFQNIQNADYWTSSTGFGNATVAVQVDVSNAAVSLLNKSNQRLRWCVRGGTGHDGGH